MVNIIWNEKNGKDIPIFTTETLKVIVEDDKIFVYNKFISENDIYRTFSVNEQKDAIKCFETEFNTDNKSIEDFITVFNQVLSIPYESKEEQAQKEIQKAKELLLDSETPVQKARRLLKEAQDKEKEDERIEKLNKEALKNAKKQEKDEERKEMVNNFTEEVEITTSFFCVQDLKDTPLYIYMNGIYEPNGETWIKSYLQNKYPNTNTGIIQEVVNRIKNKNFRPISLLDSDKYKIVMLNGVYNLETRKFEEHSPKIYSTVQLPIYYNPDLQCPKLHNYFTEVLHPEFVASAYEIFGYSLWRGNDFKKIFFFVGGNNSSKSTFMGIMRRFVGGKYINAGEMQRIAKDRFSAAELFGKLLNICGDTKSTMVKETGMLRLLSGNEDPVPAERKFGGLFNFMNYCKMVFGFNILPHIPEAEMEFFADRMFIVQFPNSFAKKPGYLDSITTPDEMSGLFNMAIQGLQRAFDNGQLTNTLTKEEIIQQYAALAEPITNFAFEAFEIDVTSHVEKDNLFTEVFKNFLAIKHISFSGSEDKFWKDLKDTITVRNPEVDWNRRISVDSKQKYVINGMKLKEIYKSTPEEEITQDIPDEQEPEFFNSDINNNGIEFPPEDEIPFWYTQGFGSLKEYEHYNSLIEEQEKSFSELYEQNFDHTEIPEENTE